jgi:flagellar basal body-associated protein FliL
VLLVAIITVMLVVVTLCILFGKNKNKKGETKTPAEDKPADKTIAMDNEANIVVEEKTAGASAGTA